MEVKLEESKALADEELAKLVGEEKEQPITYNHYFTDNVQKARRKEVRDIMEKTMEKVNATQASFGASSLVTMTPDSLIASLHGNIVVDMDERACSEAMVDLEAYYKVARKTFVDNVCKQVVERHLLKNLPDIFSPLSVAGYTDEELERIAGERPEVVEKRKRLHEELKNLKAGLRDLRA
jgi:DNA-directed RNA polymerase specialized sigma54-like protein